VHPSLEYALIGCIAAAGCYLLTPAARRIAIWWGAVAKPRDRDVHAVATPRLGGVALFAGFAMAIFVAHQLPTLRATFGSSDIDWVLVSGAMICALGVLDDKYELDSITKLAGQVAATGVMVTKGGVQMAAVYLPFGHTGTVSLGRDVGIPITILLTVLTINALNFIDGLDGLAAGVTAIGALAFFTYAYYLVSHNYIDVANTPTLLSAALAGACIGFLPHNFSPARIFMGDSGSMLLGLVLSAAATTATTSADPQSFGRLLGSLPLLLPFLPIAVLAIPFVDLLLAIVRRVRRGQSPFAPDKEHLHHRMLEIGHTHRRAVLLLYFWSALLAFGGVALSLMRGPVLIITVLSVLAAIGLLMSAVPRLRGAPGRHAAGRRGGPVPAPATDPARDPVGTSRP
jgi:UDP-GlcNAc:undecaprenyl-phosphate/decaprenyl-phosphate GlcNAc-1-phosphate transferase